MSSYLTISLTMVTDDATADARAQLWLIDASNNNVTVTLPSAADGTHIYLRFKRVDGAAGNNVTLAAAPGDNIQASTSVPLPCSQVFGLVVASPNTWQVIDACAQ
jgi:hypothetical protein